MIYLILPAGDQYFPRNLMPLLVSEIDDFDFSESAEQILRLLRFLENCGLICECPYASPQEVLHGIQVLIDDIDQGSDEVQISEYKHMRVEYRDQMLSLEVYIGII